MAEQKIKTAKQRRLLCDPSLTDEQAAKLVGISKGRASELRRRAGVPPKTSHGGIRKSWLQKQQTKASSHLVTVEAIKRARHKEARILDGIDAHIVACAKLATNASREDHRVAMVDACDDILTEPVSA